MLALFQPAKPPNPDSSCALSPQVREYFLSADVVEWDYAPEEGELCGGSKVNFSEAANVFLAPGPDRIGRKYLKAVYVEYTDATFTQKKVSQ